MRLTSTAVVAVGGGILRHLLTTDRTPRTEAPASRATFADETRSWVRCGLELLSDVPHAGDTVDGFFHNDLRSYRTFWKFEILS